MDVTFRKNSVSYPLLLYSVPKRKIKDLQDLKMDLKGCGLDSFGLQHKPVLESCEHGDDLPCSIKDGNFE
jgi:hypothetical protein